jgi:lipopolysaccharide transport system permease protein
VSFAACSVGTFKRDIIFAAFFILQIWMYASPVIYPLSAVPEAWRTLYLANPMAGIIASFRQVMVGSGPPDAIALASGSIGALVALVGGYALFKTLEKYYADVV